MAPPNVPWRFGAGSHRYAYLAVVSPDIDMIRWGHERVRLAPWHGEQGVSLLTPLPDDPPPSADFICHCLEALAGQGVNRVVTGALGSFELAPFVANGFSITEELHLLARELDVLPTPHLSKGVVLRRGRGRDHLDLLAIDRAAFDEFWQLDQPGLDDALRATTKVRLRVATRGRGKRRSILGYAITGRSENTGYLQRLAVDPGEQRRGVGAALVIDGMRWLAWWKCERMLLNTQLGNDAALRLYRRLGFLRLPDRLSVLSRGLTQPVCP